MFVLWQFFLIPRQFCHILRNTNLLQKNHVDRNVFMIMIIVMTMTLC